jgi:hypothetical protein
MCFVFQIYCWVRLVDIISMSKGEKSKIISPVYRDKKKYKRSLIDQIENGCQVRNSKTLVATLSTREK